MHAPEPAFLSGLQYGAQTDIGMRRANNQDSHAILLAEDEDTWRQRGHLFMVADGMGAHAAGEKASHLAVVGVTHLYRHYREVPAILALERAIDDTNAEIHRQGQANPDFHAMGTTFSSLVILPQGALVGHVGDSRVYRLRDDVLDQLTFDHSLQWELRALGRFGEDSELARSIPKNVITRSLGPNSEVEIDIEGPYPLEVGDTFLLCSDGLTGKVEDEEIGILLRCLSPEEAAAVLVDLANLRGGPDNITVVIAKITGDGLLEAKAPSAAKAARRPVSTPVMAAGVFSVICALLAGLLFFAEMAVPAIVAVVGALSAAAVALVQWLRSAEPTTAKREVAEPAGKGPYVSVPCKFSSKFPESLRGVLAELRQAAEESEWQLDWGRFETAQAEAENALAAGQYAIAVQKFSNAITSTMRELRR